MILKEVDIYSDGGARPNPGPWGYWIIMSYKWNRKEFYKWYKITTNNRMELTGVITGLENLKTRSRVNIYTDSQYTINGIEKWWAKKWQANNWMRTSSQKATNHDLWKRLLILVDKHEVSFNWVKWHNGHEENERCDELATLAIETLDLVEDKGFDWEEKQIKLDLKVETKQDLIKKVLNKNVDKTIRITAEWQACRKCWTKVIKAIPKKKNIKNKSFYYKYYLTCPGCSTNYFMEEAKVLIKEKI